MAPFDPRKKARGLNSKLLNLQGKLTVGQLVPQTGLGPKAELTCFQLLAIKAFELWGFGILISIYIFGRNSPNGLAPK